MHYRFLPDNMRQTFTEFFLNFSTQSLNILVKKIGIIVILT